MMQFLFMIGQRKIMPQWQHILSEEDIIDVIDHIRSLADLPFEPGMVRGCMIPIPKNERTGPLKKCSAAAGVFPRDACGQIHHSLPWRTTSNMISAAATEAFRESKSVAMGIVTRWSHCFFTRGRIPFPSLPMTRPTLPLKSVL